LYGLGQDIQRVIITLIIIVAIVSAILGWAVIEGILWLVHHVSIVIK